MFTEQNNLLKGCVTKLETAKKYLLNKETNWKKL